MSKITNGVIKALLGDGMNALGMSRDHAMALGLVPKDFGDPGYGTEARITALGITFQDLADKGLAIQSESHGALSAGIMSPGTHRIAPDRIKDEQQRRRDAYAAQHGGVKVHPIWTGTTSPGGLRLISVPEGVRASHAKQWAAQVIHAATTGDPSAEFVVPAMFAPSTGALENPTVTGVPRIGRPPKAGNQPAGYTNFANAWVSLRTAGANVLSALRSGDDQEMLQPYIAEAELIANMINSSKLGSITAAAFDTTTIRRGVKVVLLDGSPILKAAQTLCRSRFNLDVQPEATPFVIVGPRMSGDTLMGWELQPENHELPRPLFVPKTDNMPIKRIVRLKPAAQTTWKAEAGALGYLAMHEVYIESVSGDKATVFFTDPDVQMDAGHEEMETFEVPLNSVTGQPTAN